MFFFVPWCGLCYDWGPMVLFLISVDYKAFSLLVFLSWQRFFILTWNIYNTINVSTTEWNGVAVSYIAPHIMTAVIQIDIIFFSMLAFVLFLSLLLLSAHCERFWRYFFLSIISRISWMWPHLIRWIADEILFMKISHS